MYKYLFTILRPNGDTPGCWAERPSRGIPAETGIQGSPPIGKEAEKLYRIPQVGCLSRDDLPGFPLVGDEIPGALLGQGFQGTRLG